MWTFICSQYIILMPLKIGRWLSKVQKYFFYLRNAHFFVRNILFRNPDFLPFLLQCAVVGCDEYCWRSASLSIRLPERLRWIGPGQPVKTRWGTGDRISSCLLLSWSDVLIGLYVESVDHHVTDTIYSTAYMYPHRYLYSTRPSIFYHCVQ